MGRPLEESVFLDIPGAPRCTLDKLSDEELKKWTGLTRYVDTVIYPPEQYMRLWQQTPEEMLHHILTNRYIRIGFQEWLKNSPRLVLGVADALKATQTLILELRADEDVAAGTVVGEYGGLFNRPQALSSSDKVIEESDAFQSVDVTANQVGNATRWVNHGLPNVALVDLPNSFGITRSILITLTRVKKGDRFLWDYALGTSLAWKKQHLFNLEEIRTYYQKGLKVITKECGVFQDSLKDTFAKDRLNTSDSLYIQRDYLRARVFYAFNNPLVLLDLHCSGLSKAQEALDLLETPPRYLDEYFNHQRQFFNKVIKFLKKFIEYDAKISALLKPPLYQWILSSIGPLSCLQILKGLQIVANKSSILSKNTLPPFLEILNVYLSSYDFDEDPEAPFLI